MAISIKDRYPSKVDTTDVAYPQGKARNVTVSLDGTGTPFEKDLVNDLMGFQQAIYKEAGITPSGTPDSADVSQQLDGLKVIQDARSINDLSQTYTFPTVAEFKASLIEFPDGKTIHLTDRGADFTKISGQSGDGFGTIPSTSISQSIIIINTKKMSPTQYGADAGGINYTDAAMDAFRDAVIAHKFQPCFGGNSKTYLLVTATDWRDIEFLTLKGNGATIKIVPTVTPSYALRMGSSSLGGSGTGSLRKQQYINGINFQGDGNNNLATGAVTFDNSFDCGIEKSVMSGFNGADAEVVVYNSGFNFVMKDVEIGFAFQTDGNGNLIGNDFGVGVKLLADYLETSTIELDNVTIFGGKYNIYIPEQNKTTDGITFKNSHFNRPYRYGIYCESNDGPTAGGALRITSMKLIDCHFEGYLSDIITVDPRPIFIRATPSNNEGGKGLYGLDINGLYLSGIQHGPKLLGCENGCTIKNIWYASTSLTYSTITFTGASSTTYNVIELGNDTIATIDGVFPNIQEANTIGTGDTVRLRQVLNPAGTKVIRSGESELDDNPLNRSVAFDTPKYKTVSPVIGSNVVVDFVESRANFGSVAFRCDTTGATGNTSRVFVSIDGDSGKEFEVANVINDGTRFFASFDMPLDAGKFRFRAFGGDVSDNFEFWLLRAHYDGTNLSVVSEIGA